MAVPALQLLVLMLTVVRGAEIQLEFAMRGHILRLEPQPESPTLLMERFAITKPLLILLLVLVALSACLLHMASKGHATWIWGPPPEPVREPQAEAAAEQMAPGAAPPASPPTSPPPLPAPPAAQAPAPAGLPVSLPIAAPMAPTGALAASVAPAAGQRFMPAPSPVMASESPTQGMQAGGHQAQQVEFAADQPPRFQPGYEATAAAPSSVSAASSSFPPLEASTAASAAMASSAAAADQPDPADPASKAVTPKQPIIRQNRPRDPSRLLNTTVPPKPGPSAHERTGRSRSKSSARSDASERSSSAAASSSAAPAPEDEELHP